MLSLAATLAFVALLLVATVAESARRVVLVSGITHDSTRNAAAEGFLRLASVGCVAVALRTGVRDSAAIVAIAVIPELPGVSSAAVVLLVGHFSHLCSRSHTLTDVRVL